MSLIPEGVSMNPFVRIEMIVRPSRMLAHPRTLLRP